MKQPTRKLCPMCGAAMMPQAKKCTRCGSPLKGK